MSGLTEDDLKQETKKKNETDIFYRIIDDIAGILGTG
jgi:hypothetical protein